jgi:hypothetical protein
MDRSDEAAHVLLDVDTRFSPENASRLGIESADEQVGDMTPGFRDRHLAALRQAGEKLRALRAAEKDPLVAGDLDILIRAGDLDRRDIELDESAMLPFWQVARRVFFGAHVLLDEQVPAARRARVVARLRRYAGMEPGSTPITELAKADLAAHLTRAGLTAPLKIDVEKYLATTAPTVDGIAKLCAKFQVPGYEEPLKALTKQIADYDEYVRATLLPRARTEFPLPPAVYALALEKYGVDMPQDELIAAAHKEFTELQAEMQKIATTIAAARKLPSADYRDVIRELKKQQIVGEAILPHYKERLAEIETIIRREHLVTLPNRPARIRLGTAAESAQQPAPHMQPARLLGNTGEQGEFVLPLSIPAPTGSKEADAKYDDFTHAAASWTLTAHEARPGHELQFDTMVERGVTIARANYAFNSANVEGWGLYSESIVLPFMPPEGQLVSLQLRLQRAARAFLDPELQRGKWTFESARDFLVKEVVLSPPFATSEVERYTFRSPGQATSYFYGFLRLRALRREVETALGTKFDLQKFDDAILDEGLLPPDLMRKAVLAKLAGG